MSRLFIADDGWSDSCVWEHDPTGTGRRPQPVLALRNVNDAALRNAIVALVESGEVQ